MPSPFENLGGPGKPLKSEPADAKEFAGLKRAGLARLLDASNTGLALESRFDLGYNAAAGHATTGDRAGPSWPGSVQEARHGHRTRVPDHRC